MAGSDRDGAWGVLEFCAWQPGSACAGVRMSLPDLVTGAIAFLLTLMVLSYLIGDNPLFRIAVYIFVGVSAGYVAVVAYRQVLVPDLIPPLLTGAPLERSLLSIPLFLVVVLLMKVLPQLTPLGTPA